MRTLRSRSKVFLTVGILVCLTTFMLSSCTTYVTPLPPGPVYGKVWVPGHFNRWGGWVPGHWRRY